MGRAGVAALLGGLGVWVGSGGAAEPFTPSWLVNRPEKRAVTIDLAAAWNTNNAQANWNGFHAGALTLVVPAGWQVVLHLHNLDAEYPHSLVLTRAYPPSEMPLRLTAAEAAVAQAFTPAPEVGDPPGAASTVTFTADPPGDYYLACGVPVHLMDDMYLRLRISDEVLTAQAVLDEALVAKDALAGRP